MRKANIDVLLLNMYIAKNIYKSYPNNVDIRRNSMIYASILIYIYTNKDASTLDMYYMFPFAKSSQINMLNALIDLGYIYKHDKKVERSVIYSLTPMGYALVTNSMKSELNPKRTPNKYKYQSLSSLTLS